MIKSSALSDLLKKVISKGIETVFISKVTGEILCIEGKDTNQTLSDLVSSMWIEYNQIGQESLKNEKLNFLLIENDDSNIMTSNIYNYIICMKANKSIQLGMLRKNLEGLTHNLNKVFEPFKDILQKKEEVNEEEEED